MMHTFLPILYFRPTLSSILFQTHQTISISLSNNLAPLCFPFTTTFLVSTIDNALRELLTAQLLSRARKDFPHVWVQG